MSLSPKNGLLARRPLKKAFASGVLGFLVVWPVASSFIHGGNTHFLGGQTPPGYVLAPDQDDDGIPDYWEQAWGLNPANPSDAWADPDRDLVVNLFEYQLGSDPKDKASPPIISVGCSSKADYNDLATALDGCARGSVIRIAKGVYRVNYSTSAVKAVMIQGGWSPDFRKRSLKLFPTTLDGGKKDGILSFSAKLFNPVIILDGLRIIRSQGYLSAVGLNASGTAFIKASILNCLIVDNELPGSLCGAVGLFTSAYGLLDFTLANTCIAGNKGSGIYANLQAHTASRWRIVHSALSGNLKVNDYQGGLGIDAAIYNYLSSGSLDAHIFNSILWGNSRGDLSISGKIRFTVDHSDLGLVLDQYGAECIRGEGNLEVDPLFEDAKRGNYHLKLSSPVINKGVNKGVPLIDFEGDPRVKGTLPDMGPDER